MSVLPRPAFPTYEIVIPSLKKKVKYRPYLTKEEKVLSIAFESEDISEITNAVKLILQNCIQTKDIDVEKLSTFDIEYLFLNIRAKAVGEELKLKVLCPDSEEDDPVYADVEININDIKVKETKGHTNIIKVDEDLTMIMKYPTFDYFIKEQFEMPQDSKGQYEISYDLVSECVDKICKDDEVWQAEDVGKEEIIDFLGDLTSAKFKLIQEFLETMPKLEHEVEVVNPKTGKKSKVTLSGIVDFFI